MTHIFAGCNSLVSLPDISKWNTSKVEDMSYMFYGCKSLKSLPDISNWNTSSVKNLKFMFYGCIPSLKLPDFYILLYMNIVFEVTYKINSDKKDRLRIIGNKFINKNKNKGKIVYNNSHFKLTEYFEDIDNNYKEDKIKFLLCLNKNIDDMSYLFSQCESLISVNRKIFYDRSEIKNQIYKDDNESNQISDSSIILNSNLNISNVVNDNINFDENYLKNETQTFRQ